MQHNQNEKRTALERTAPNSEYLFQLVAALARDEELTESVTRDLVFNSRTLEW